MCTQKSLHTKENKDRSGWMTVNMNMDKCGVTEEVLYMWPCQPTSTLKLQLPLSPMTDNA